MLTQPDLFDQNDHGGGAIRGTDSLPPEDLQPFKSALIYEPRGKAREYADLALNVYKGCDHACVYCYVPEVLRMSRSAFINPLTRGEGFVDKVEREAKKLTASTHKDKQVLLSFTTDPYQALDEQEQVTRQVLSIFRRVGVRFITLTKGGHRAERDLDLFTDRDAFATTLTLLDEHMRVKWEPGSAPTQERIETLARFHKIGVPTWVSLEPVIDPQQTMEIIRRSHEVVDLFKVGKLNHVPNLEKTIDWTAFGHEVISLLKSYGKPYYVKHELEKFL